MKKGFSKNTVEIFGKTVFHYVPDIMKYIDEIQDIRKRKHYTMRYLIMSEMLMFFSEGKFQKAHYEISKEWLSETREGKTSWYLSMLDLKLVANGMAISIMNEMINNEDKKTGKDSVWMWITN